LAQEEDVFFSEHFLLPRPLLKALTSDEPVVLLIDEIDRADVEFEAFLLEVLSDFQVSVPELGTIRAKHQPMVLLTSNNTRELSEALKRRCLYLYVGYPNLEAELDIVRLKVPDLRPEMARQAVAVVQQLRNMDLRKVPSISETLDWARALVALNARAIDEQTMNNTLTVLLKYEADAHLRAVVPPVLQQRCAAVHGQRGRGAGPRRSGAAGRGHSPVLRPAARPAAASAERRAADGRRAGPTGRAGGAAPRRSPRAGPLDVPTHAACPWACRRCRMRSTTCGRSSTSWA
jgi:hypothetical protein